MIVLGIESTCDETGCSVVRNGKEILSNIVASQEDIHEKFGGVFPELAARRHSQAIIPLIEKSLKEAGVTFDEIDLISVANGPGLIGALLVGVNTAKGLALSLKKPLMGVNHVEAHLYASLMSHENPPTFPCLGVVLSGAHTHILLMEEIGHYKVLAQTHDDAIGEAFDKVARVLNLPYPGGPRVEILARSGNPNKHFFKCGQIKGRPLDFSFSGIKTGVLYAVKGQNGVLNAESSLTDEQKRDIAASFQHCIFTDLIKKIILAAKEHNCTSIVLGGGVTNNQRLRSLFAEAAPDLHFYWPSAGLSLDNGAMIAGYGYHQFMKKGKGDSFDLEALPRIPL